MPGGYASHIGLAPALFDDGASMEDKGILMRDRVIAPLFAPKADGSAPFYVYFNIDSAARLRKILTNPEKYVPSGIYIMRIHGTFVNFLDLAPAIQEDIIKRLERSENA
jgi:formate C-acetyltransferase